MLLYTFTAGLLANVPRVPILEETIRNLYFHVCMWFCMMILFITSVVYAIKYLRSNNLIHDIYSHQFAAVGIIFGILGYSTGIVWMSYTWADPHTTSFAAVAREPKLIGAAIALLIYFAYLILRDSIPDMDKKARVSAVYNIFAFALLFPTIWIVPRLMDSLHPGGKSANPALDFRQSDLRLKIVFYPAVIAWTLLGVWITSLKIRMKLLKEKSLLHE